jgi:hypothetical protein
MNKKMKVFSLGLGLIGFALMAPGSGKASPCVNCHTMHNMQSGVDLGGPNDTLLKFNTCIGCHAGVNVGGVSDGVNVSPYVYSAGAIYGTNTLAGGNFRWVEETSGDSKGHNVISAVDGTIVPANTPPGWNENFIANGAVAPAGAWGTQLTCAGTYGCHGDHTVLGDFGAMSGSHHANDTTIDGGTVGTSYRFLKGIIGKEDSHWEFPASLTALDHNQYYGYVRSSDTPPAAASEGAKGISYLCAECHGNFHSDFLAGNLGACTADTFVSPWLRHPTDINMEARGGEYLAYGVGFGGVGVYQPLVPVATDVTTAGVVTAIVSDVFAGGNNNSIVTCISCHRAHGSPYPDLMRWDYNGDVVPAEACSAGTDNAACGCFRCHTTKDAG